MKFFKKLFGFGEDRELHQNEEGESPDAKPVVVEAPESKVSEEVEAGKEGAKTDSQKELVKVKSDMNREQLKQTVQQENAEALTNFEAYSQIQNLKIEQNFNFSDSIDAYRSIFKGMVLSKISDAHVVELAKFLEAETGDLKDVLAEVHVNSMFKYIKAEVQKRKSFYDEFVKKTENSGVNVYYRFRTGPTGSYYVDFYPSQFNTGYNVQEQENGDPEKQKEKQQKAQRAAQVEALKSTPVGRILVMMGYDKAGLDGKTGFDRIFDGTDFIGIFILGILGYDNIPGIAESYEGLKGMMPDKYKSKVEKWEKKARGSKLANPELKDQKPAEGEEAKVESGKTKKVSNAQFKQYLKGVSKPEGDFELESDFKLAIGDRPESFEVDLSAGGKVTFPAGASYKVGDSLFEVKAEDAPKLVTSNDAKKLEFTSSVMKGTKFEGKVKFIKQESAEA